MIWSIRFWMSVAGYLIRPGNIPIFWYSWAYWVNFQKYAYQLLINFDFHQLVFQVSSVFRLDPMAVYAHHSIPYLQCQGNVIAGCSCSFPSSLIDKGICAVSGEDVLTVRGLCDGDCLGV
jgi:hypothetical protein